jgi:hypothetical protein
MELGCERLRSRPLAVEIGADRARRPRAHMIDASRAITPTAGSRVVGHHPQDREAPMLPGLKPAREPKDGFRGNHWASAMPGSGRALLLGHRRRMAGVLRTAVVRGCRPQGRMLASRCRSGVTALGRQ